MSSEETAYVRQSSGLVKAVSPRNALLANLVGMGIVVNIFWVVFASALYPGADLPFTVFLGLGLNLLVAFVYWMLATSMPRAGGDFVYVSRIFHPAVGLMVNSMFVAIMISWAGLFPQLTVAQGLQMMYANLATATGSAYYSGVASWLSTQAAQFEVGAIILLLVIAVMFMSVKWIFRITIAIFAVQAVIYLWFIGALAGTSHAAFVAGFAKSGTTVDAIVKAAADPNIGGAVLGITLGGTLVGVVYTMLSYIGYANSAYFAGEVKGEARRSQGIAIFVSPIIFGILIYVLYAEIYNVFGHDFLVAASTLATSSSPSVFGHWGNYTAAIPSPAYLVSFISSDPLFTAAVPFGLALTFVGFTLVYFFIPVRNIFAWAFDRVIPVRFADVDRRGVPRLAVLFYAVVAFIALYLTVYTSVFSYLAYANFGWWIAVALVMFSAAAFPYRRKDIFSSSASIVQKRVGSIPLLTIVGIFGGLLSLYVSYATILPAYTGGALSPIYVASMLVIFAVALIVYAISYYYRKSKGISLSVVMKRLPPE